MTVVSPERAKHGYLLGGDEGEAFWLLGMLEIIKLSGEDTNGEYGLIEVTVRAGEGSPWHVHPDEDEWFYVLEGEFTVYVGERRLSLPAGSFAFGPKGVPHTFIAVTDGAKALIGFHTTIRNALARPWAIGGQGSTAAESKPAAAASCLTLRGVYDDS